MSGLFGQNKQAAAMAAAARKDKQEASEDTMRNMQQAERGGQRRNGRALLIGNLSRLNTSNTTGG